MIDLPQQFKNLGIISLDELITGIKLAEIINKIFYNNNNEQFMNKLIKDNQHRKGNNVINMNIILKQIKNDSNIICPESIFSLTSFSLIEDKSKMIQFLTWILHYNSNIIKSPIYSPREQYKYIQSPQKQFENLYFAADISPNKKSPQYNDSLDGSDKVVKKGSFKVFKPKTDFHLASPSIKNQLSPQKLKQIHKDRYNSMEHHLQKDLSQRKTIPKISQKPPICRKSNKQNTKILIKQKQQKYFFKDPNPFQVDSNRSNKSNQKQQYKNQNYKKQQIKNNNKKKRQQLKKQIINLQKQIKKQNIKQKIYSSQKKLFKLQILQLKQDQKKDIINWLISINLLNILSINYYNRLHQICKNGVIFPQIINYHKGRSNQLCYFKNPKRSTQIHTNYQKVFDYLQQIPSFSSELIYLYQYFIPQAQQKSFWSLLNSIYQCFKPITKDRKKTQNVINYQQQVQKKFQRTVSMSIPKQVNNIQYQKIKYGTNSCKRVSKQYDRKNSQKKIQFIKQLPDTYLFKQKLIQNQQPIQSNNNIKGYKQLYDRKSNRKYDTPKKSTNIINNSMSRSRILSMGSFRKSQQKKIQIPLINLDMQMKVLKFLQDKSYNNWQNRDNLELFKDPLRNGVLLNQIIQKQLNLKYTYYQKPKNIQNCRQNVKYAIHHIKKQIPQLHAGYYYYSQDIIKGDKCLFYGLIYHIILMISGQPIQKSTQNGTNFHSFNQIIDTNKTSQTQRQQSIMLWIRNLQQQNNKIAQLKIRDIQTLSNNIIDLLYQLYSLLNNNKTQINLNYPKPISQIQVQSNLKKILSYYQNNKLLSSQYLNKYKKIIKKDDKIIKQLCIDLIQLTKILIFKQKQQKTVTFVKYLRPQQQIKKNYQRLDTTMANNYSNLRNYQEKQILPVFKQRQNNQNNQLDIKWMRKLGFNQNLNLNNGVILCKLISKLTMKNIQGYHNNPQSKAQCLLNIRKAIKVIGPQFKWQQGDVFQADLQCNIEMYKFLKEKYKHAYALKFVN